MAYQTKLLFLRTTTKYVVCSSFNPLMGTGNYTATSNDMKLVHWPLMGVLLHLV